MLWKRWVCFWRGLGSWTFLCRKLSRSKKLKWIRPARNCHHSLDAVSTLKSGVGLIVVQSLSRTSPVIIGSPFMYAFNNSFQKRVVFYRQGKSRSQLKTTIYLIFIKFVRHPLTDLWALYICFKWWATSIQTVIWWLVFTSTFISLFIANLWWTTDVRLICEDSIILSVWNLLFHRWIVHFSLRFLRPTFYKCFGCLNCIATKLSS